MSATNRELLDRALTSAHPQLGVTPEIRKAIRQICASAETLTHEHEDSLIAFKLALVDAANSAKIRPSPERNDLFAKLVTIYIDEFYSAANTSGSSGKKGAQGFASNS